MTSLRETTRSLGAKQDRHFVLAEQLCDLLTPGVAEAILVLTQIELLKPSALRRGEAAAGDPPELILSLRVKPGNRFLKLGRQRLGGRCRGHHRAEDLGLQASPGLLSSLFEKS